MKVLTISNCDLIESQGSGYVIMGFATGLRDSQHEVKLVGPKDVLLLPGIKKGRSLRLALGMAVFVLRNISGIKPDIIEFYGAESWLASWILSKRTKRSFSIVSHSNGIESLVAEALEQKGINNTFDGAPHKWYQGKVRVPTDLAFFCADAIVTVSKQDADYAARRRFKEVADILAIENALDRVFLEVPFKESNSKVIGFCGSWIPRKGTELIISDISRILIKFPGWKFHLVGVGSNFDVSNIFPAEVQGRIIITEFVREKNELKLIYQSWSIALMPSLHESFGLVGAEAMACGCALVACNTGFATALENGVNALIIDNAKSPDLELAVGRLISEPGLRADIAREGWKRVQSLRWSTSIHMVEEFYEELIVRRKEKICR